MASKKDFYEVLGVTKTATDAEIKSAYRRLARQHHPDVDKSAGAETRFKELSEAYQVLSDPQKKQTYDQYGSAAFQPGAGGGAAGNPFGQGFSYSWTGNGGNPGDGGGFADPFDLFEQIFGMGGFAQEFANGFRRRQTYQMDITFEDAISGITKEVEIERVEGNQNQVKREKITIKVPAGVDEGTRMRFGDVDIVFRVRPSKEFQREGSSIYSELILSVPQAVLGDIVAIKTVQGKVSIKIPAGTQPDSLIRVKGQGAPTLQGSFGDHFVKVTIEIPKNPSNQEKELYEQLSALRKGSSGKKKSWF